MSLTEFPVLVVPGFTATGSITQYKLVRLTSTAGQVKQASSATANVIGVCMNDPVHGQAVAIGAIGIFKCLCEASTTIGATVGVSSTGRVKVDTSATAKLIGIALDAYSTAGGLVRVMMNRGGNAS